MIMSNIQNMYDYTVIANLFSDETMEVLVGFKGGDDSNNLFLLNKFPYTKKNIEFFKELFFYFSSKDKDKDFVEFFTFERHFYAVFKYNRCENIKIKYAKDVCTASFEKRCVILEGILMKLSRISNMPIDVMACISDPLNICVDSDDGWHIMYNLKNIFSNENYDMRYVYKNIRKIIFTMLQVEAEGKFNKDLHIVLDKCNSGVYSSIPELVVDLKRAEKTSRCTTLFSYIKYRLGLKKDIIAKVGKYSTTTAIVVGLLVLAYNKITENTGISNSAPVVAIGDINYNGDNSDESSKDVETQKQAKQKKKSEVEINLSPGLDIEYEDYIVQYGDTLESICDSYYKDKDFIKAVSTFNDVDEKEKLVAGRILKLPNRTAVALYLSN